VQHIHQTGDVKTVRHVRDRLRLIRVDGFW
jgi:hypothetical protein